jgi:hypothetical protein
MPVMANEPKRKGRAKDPNSKRSKGVDRHINPRVVFHLDRALFEAMNQYRSAARPRPTKAATIAAAIEAFLQEKGYWPPPAESD